MPLPEYFTATTLRTLSATTGEEERRVRELADRVRLHLVVGNDEGARLAAEAFVELAARTFGSLRVTTRDGGTRASLEARGRRINPRLDTQPARATHRVGLGSTEADLAYWGAGWWTGRELAPMPHPNGASPVGPVLAGILGFKAAFDRAFAPVLTALRPTPSTLVEWSSLDLVARKPVDGDFEPLPPTAHGPTALVGCGAIGQSFAFVVGKLTPTNGALDLIDPQPLSASNLQRYVGTTAQDGAQRQQKVVVAARQLAKAYPTARRFNRDWTGYLRSLNEQRRPFDREIVVTALDSAADRRVVQAGLPRLIINGWTRLSECGVTVHDFAGPSQCLVCTYLPREPGAARNEVAQLAGELGLLPLRVVHLLAGASLGAADLRTIERSRRLPALALERWRGESLRPLYGELCGIARIPKSEREHYLVPLPHASALAGLLVAAEFIRTVASVGLRGQRIDLSVIRGPGTEWAQPPALKEGHPAPCICKDDEYLSAYREKWGQP